MISVPWLGRTRRLASLLVPKVAYAMSLRRTLFSSLTIAAIFASATTLGQTPRKKPDKTAEPTDLQQTRLFNLIQVKKFAERALSFKDLSTQVLTVSRLANLLWDDDEVHARQLFTKALDACSLAEATASKASKRGVISTRRQIIGYISRRDTKWGATVIRFRSLFRR